MDDTEYRVKLALAEQADVPLASVYDHHILTADLDLDSLDLVKLGQNLEENFGVEVPDSSIKSAMTVADLVSEIRRLTAAAV